MKGNNMRGPKFGFDFGGGFAADRIFRRRGGLKYYVLWLLQEKPMKGSEIMAEIERQTHGWWRPSPGTIYPLLSSMEEDHLVRKGEDTKYEITEGGLEEIGMKESPRGDATGSVDSVIKELDGIVSYLEDTSPLEGDRKEKLSKISERINKLLR